ncbi:MAG: RsmE family RNA methyltransferase, partial [Nitrospira sp.]
LKEVLSTLNAPTIALFLAERQEGIGLGTVPLPSDTKTTILLLIGPEGGWSKEEVLMAQRAGCTFITLGPSILRAETAAITAISILQSRLGNLGPVSPT